MRYKITNAIIGTLIVLFVWSCIADAEAKKDDQPCRGYAEDSLELCQQGYTDYMIEGGEP